MRNGEKRMISVIIPAYNEENSIGQAIDEIKEVLKKNNLYENSEIIVVNDGSTDNTRRKALEKEIVLLDNPTNIGYGYSLKKGISNAKNETIVITDGDLTYPFDEVPKMLKLKKQGFDLVVGARTGKYYKESIPKNILRKGLKFFAELISGKKIKDVNSGLRIFDKSTVIKYFPRLCNTYSFTTSQTLAYFMNDLSVCYTDIQYNKRNGKSKVKLIRDSVIAARYILEVGIFYNPIKILILITILVVAIFIICFIFLQLFGINVGIG